MVKKLLLALLIPVSFIVILYITLLFMVAQSKHPVGAIVPQNFPVLVITQIEDRQYSPQMVLWGDLQDFLNKNPQYTYLVPEGMEDVFNKDIQSKCQAYSRRNTDRWWSASFMVKRLANGRQSLEVHCTWDDDVINEGWYEATDKEIFPKYYRVYSQHLLFRAFFVTFFLTALFWIIGLKVYDRIRKKRLQAV